MNKQERVLCAIKHISEWIGLIKWIEQTEIAHMKIPIEYKHNHYANSALAGAHPARIQLDCNLRLLIRYLPTMNHNQNMWADFCNRYVNSVC